jgi:hypothetical protein
MTDQFQLTTIIATAIKQCGFEMPARPGGPQQQDPGDMEEAHCIAKAVLAAIAEAGFEISPKQAAS